MSKPDDTIVWKNGTDSSNIVARYCYDYAGDRLKVVEGNAVTHYVYGYAGKVLFEAKYTTTAADPMKAKGAELVQSKTTYYVYANGHQLAKVEGAIGKGVVYYYHNDNLGSTMMMTRQVFSATGENSVVFKQDYTPFGQNLLPETEKVLLRPGLEMSF